MTNLDTSFVGKSFKHYCIKDRIYTIVDIQETKSFVTGKVVSQVFIAENTCMGQVVRGEMPLSTITRSVQKNGWIK